MHADVVLFPEAYGFTGTATFDFEPMISDLHTVPCSSNATTRAAAVTQHGMSCAAKQSNVTIVANFFVELPSNGTKRIASIAFASGTGAVLAVYYKHHLFPNEALSHIQPGPFAPTVFDAPNGKKFGLLICYEGLWAELHRDYSQLLALKAQGADAVLWSIGGLLPDKTVGKSLAKHSGLTIIASEDRAEAAAIRGSDASKMAANVSVPLAIANYTNSKASLVVFELAL